MRESASGKTLHRVSARPLRHDRQMPASERPLRASDLSDPMKSMIPAGFAILKPGGNQTRSTCPSGPILRGISVFGSSGRTFTCGAAVTAPALLAAGSVTFFAMVDDGFLAADRWPVFFRAPGLAGAVCASGGFQTSTYRSPAYALEAMLNNATGKMNVRKKGLHRGPAAP